MSYDGHRVIPHITSTTMGAPIKTVLQNPHQMSRMTVLLSHSELVDAVHRPVDGSLFSVERKRPPVIHAVRPEQQAGRRESQHEADE